MTAANYHAFFTKHIFITFKIISTAKFGGKSYLIKSCQNLLKL